jgi:hypothetical protein
MRLKLNGERYAQDKSIQDQGIQEYWRGGPEQTRAYYQRHTEQALGWLKQHDASYARHFDHGPLVKAIKTLEALAEYLEVSE